MNLHHVSISQLDPKPDLRTKALNFGEPYDDSQNAVIPMFLTTNVISKYRHL